MRNDSHTVLFLLNLFESSLEKHGHTRSQLKNGTFSIIRFMVDGLTLRIAAIIDPKAQLKQKHFNEDAVIMPRKQRITRSFQQIG